MHLVTWNQSRRHLKILQKKRKMRRNGSSPLLGFVFAAVIQIAVATFGEAQEVSLTTEMISMPTYTMGPDEKQPIFRGFTVPGMNVFRAARTTYPYPRADNFGHEREMKEYEAITLENEFIKAVVIPDL